MQKIFFLKTPPKTIAIMKQLLLKTLIIFFAFFTFLVVDAKSLSDKVIQLELPSKSCKIDEPYKIFKDWIMLLETNDHVEISSRIVQCELGGDKQIQLMVFNEGEAKNIRFTLTVLNPDNKNTFSKEIIINTSRGQMLIATCDKTDKSLNDLKINLPSDYNPENLTVTVEIIK